MGNQPCERRLDRFGQVGALGDEAIEELVGAGLGRPCTPDPDSGMLPWRYIIPTAQRVEGTSWIRALTSSLAEAEMNSGYAEAASASRSAPTAIETNSPG